MRGLLDLLLFPTPRADAGRTPGPSDDFWYEGIGLAGGKVSPELAESLDAYFACQRVLAESVGILPFITYRRTKDGGKERATDDPRYKVLRWMPDGRGTAQAYWEMVVLHLIRRGAHTALKVYALDGTLERLVALNPDRVTAEELDSGRIVYHYRNRYGRMDTYTAAQVFRVTFLTLDGVTPMSVLAAAARATRLGLEAEQYAQTAFTNDPTSNLAIINKTGWHKDADGRKAFTDSLIARGTGANRHKPLVLEGEGDIKQLRLSMEELQLMQSRLFSLRSLARIFRVQLHLLGDLEHATFSNIEHQGIEFVTLSLAPWLVRIEQAVQLQLFTDDEDLFGEFLTEALVRGDMASRYQAHASALSTGWKTPNEVRATENLNPVEGGDVLRTPLNMGRAAPEPRRADDRKQQIAQAAARRLVRQEVEGLAKLARKHGDDAPAWVQAVHGFCRAHAADVAATLKVSMGAASTYTERNRERVLAGGLAALEADLDGAERALLQLIEEDDDAGQDQSAA